MSMILISENSSNSYLSGDDVSRDSFKTPTTRETLLFSYRPTASPKRPFSRYFELTAIDPEWLFDGDASDGSNQFVADIPVLGGRQAHSRDCWAADPPALPRDRRRSESCSPHRGPAVPAVPATGQCAARGSKPVGRARHSSAPSPSGIALSRRALDILPIEDQHVKRNVEVQSDAEALDQSDCTGLGHRAGNPAFLIKCVAMQR